MQYCHLLGFQLFVGNSFVGMVKNSSTQKKKEKEKGEDRMRQERKEGNVLFNNELDA